MPTFMLHKIIKMPKCDSHILCNRKEILTS